MPQKHLTLFFTRNVSLRTWADVGMIGREIAIYQRLQQHGYNISFVTYGDRSDIDFADQIPGIKILCNYRGWPMPRYERWLHLLHGRHLFRTDIIKSNQMSGADIALRAAAFWRKPLIARCGYMWSFNAAKEFGEESEITRLVLNIETRAFSSAKSIVVTTSRMAENVIHRVPSAKARTRVIPNYVETDRFAPIEGIEKDIDILFVGRLSPEKNIVNLLTAVKALDANITIVGQGYIEAELKQQFGDMNGRLTWQGRVPNKVLPRFMNRAKVFILPSHYEGHPKTLLEAMACGLPVIGTNSPGVEEQIEHEKTGLLCDTDADSIREVIKRLLNNQELQSKLGANARQHIVENISLDRIFQLELDNLKRVTTT